ncbi:MAG: hypothetical protein R3263_05330 [Myxococcota bacterium]|nr:hypothetical protein [Myxococcota bacterium]
MRATIVRGAFGLAFSGLLALGAGAAFAETAVWDQERVAVLAAELHQDVKDLKVTVQRNPDQPIGGARRAQYEARDQLRVLQTLARHLANDLEDGADREATITTYKRIQTVRRDLEEIGRKANLQNNTMEAVMEVQDVLRRLAPYYEEGGA